MYFVRIFFLFDYCTYINYLFILFLKKKTWDIELSNVEKDYSDISIAHNKLLEENRWLKSEMDSIVEKTNER
jgi:hypothetical protein